MVVLELYFSLKLVNTDTIVENLEVFKIILQLKVDLFS